jgi:hypothetical protein
MIDPVLSLLAVVKLMHDHSLVHAQPAFVVRRYHQWHLCRSTWQAAKAGQQICKLYGGTAISLLTFSIRDTMELPAYK